jgi:hypothetical protein
MPKEIKDSGTISAVLFVLFVVVSMMFIGCAAMDSSVANSGAMTSMIQNHTVKALKADVDPATIKIIYDEESSSYISGSNWYAVLPDGKKYKCNKMREEAAFCVKIKKLPVSKKTAVK